MGYRDPVGSPLPVPHSRIGYKAYPGLLPEMETLGLRVIFAKADGITQDGFFPDGPFVFQTSPLNAFEEQFAYNHGDFMTAFAGERSRPGGRQLETIQFDTLWLDDGSIRHGPSWTIVKQAIDPIAAKNQLKTLLYSGQPFWMMVHQMPLWGKYDLRMMVTMRSLTASEHEGEVDTRYFTIQVREWRPAAVEELQMGTGAPHGAGKRGPQGSAVLVTSLPDTQDSMQLLSKQCYGTTTLWTTLARANGITGLGPSESLVDYFKDHPAKKLFIPPLASVAGTANRG